MNKIIIQGRLTRDPEVKTVGADLRVWRISVAVDRRPGKDGTKKVDFFNCDALLKTGDMISKYFRKGDGIILSGRMESSRKDTTTYWSLTVEDFEFPMSRKVEDAAPAEPIRVPVPNVPIYLEPQDGQVFTIGVS